MSHADTLESMFGAQRIEPAVTQFTGGHFYAYAMFRRKGTGIEAGGKKFDAMLPGPHPDRLLISIGLLPSQMEIAMGKAYLQRPVIRFAGTVEKLSHNDGIDSPAHGEKNRFSIFR